MEEEILSLIKQGITEFDEIQTLSNISKKNLSLILQDLIEQDILYHPKGTKYYGYMMKGIVTIKSAGYGFITVEGEEADYFVKEDFLNNIYNGDTVLFYPYFSGHRLCNGAIIKVLKRNHEFIIGHFKRRTKKGKVKSFIYSSNPKFPIKAIVKKEIPNLEEDVIVYGKLSYVGTAIEAEVLEIIGHKDDPGIEISEIALSFGFQLEFPKDVYDEIHMIEEYVSEEEMLGRKDFRDHLIITIDGDDSKDFDDAIEIKKNDDGSFELGVYIADVSHYVKEGSHLDREALKRGTSVYLADRVIPMLPHKLSNGIYSLNENVERLVLACLMTISKEGNLMDYDIVEGVIRSKHRMTYRNVNELLKGNKEIEALYPDLIEPIKAAYELSKIIRRKRTKKGGIDFDIKEYKFKLSEEGEPIEIHPIERDDAELLIEDFMLMANETVAYHMNIMSLPCMYRVHEKPDQDKLLETLEQLKDLGIDTEHSKKKITSLDLQKIIKNMEELPHKEIYHNLVLRSMMKARYSDACLGHYGLAMQYYCHFTSPIRRYPDLMVHRIIKQVLLHPKNLEEDINHFNQILSDIALRNSKSERNSVDCEREVNDMLYAWYMEKHINSTFKGVITSFTSFGIFVTLDNGVEGLVSIDSMSRYFTYDEEEHYYTDGKTIYRLADEVEVIVIYADRTSQRVDFMFLNDYNLGEV
ncbi:MAG: ribonuclease R [Roseburia sp.]|nr:ribonuclease R [Anaeroplasma bactoclasticum]MCM1196629.1 ribonuclease R [Roseburia sp.]MCM1557406.1 ribonuclease R [Anaeroplasma bactoclasticum]